MADKYWLADSAKAWDDGTAWTGGVKPGAGDNAIFLGDHNGNVTAPAAPETVANIYVTTGYTGTMGTSGAKLQVSCARLQYEGAGAEAWWKGSYDSVVCRGIRYEANSCSIEGTFAGDEWITVLSGRVDLVGAAFINVHVSKTIGGTEPVVQCSSGVALNRLIVEAGRFSATSLSISSDLIIKGGQVILTDLASSIGRLVMCAGLLRILGTVALTFGRAYVMGGVVDCGDFRGKITVGVNLFVASGAYVDFQSGQPAAGTAGYWVLIMPGGKCFQSGSGLVVEFLA